MNGLDQVVVYMWFLPVVLFIVMPLCVGAVWWPISLFVKIVRREEAQERVAEMVAGEARETV
jgi:uncharacterized membrane protein YqiK